MAQVRLQVVAFGSFVPGIEEQQPLIFRGTASPATTSRSPLAKIPVFGAIVVSSFGDGSKPSEIRFSRLSGSTPHGVDSNPIVPAEIANRGRTNYGHTVFVNKELDLLFLNSANNGSTLGCQITFDFEW